MNYFRSKKVWLVLVILALVGYGGYRWWQSRNSTEVVSAPVQKGSLKQELVLSGKIDADEKADLHFQSSGQLAWIGVKEGDYIEKNHAFAGLDIRQLKKTLDKKMNDYLISRWDFEQSNETYNANGQNYDKVVDLTDDERRILEKSQYGLNKAILDVEIQNLAVKYATLTTPISGIFTHVGAKYPGMNVLYTDTFTVVNLDSLFLDVSADQTEAVDLHIGQGVNIVLDAFEDQVLKGKVSWIGYTPKAGEVGTVYQVKVQFEDLDEELKSKLRLGMTGDATFVTAERENTLYVPIQFLKTDSQGDYVLVGDDAHRVDVTSGIETDTEVEISGDVKEGDLVYQE